MTPRERWLAVLAGESADHTPGEYWADAATARLRRDAGCARERG